MTIKKLGVLITFVVCLSGCKNSATNNEYLQIDLTGKAGETSLNFNDECKNIRVIKLETNEKSLMKYFYGHIGKKYIIAKRRDKILQFTAQGKYIRTIIKKGNGPNEFRYIDAHCVDNSENFFMYHEESKDGIFRYDLNKGEFVEPITFKSKGYITKMISINDTTLSILPGQFAKYGHLHFKYSHSGRIIDGVKKANTKSPGAWAGTIPVFLESSDNSFIYQPSNNDTIYRLVKNKKYMEVICKVNKPKKNGNSTIKETPIFTFRNNNKICLYKHRLKTIIEGNHSAGSESLGGSFYLFDNNQSDLKKVKDIIFEFHGAKLKLSYITTFFNNTLWTQFQSYEFKNKIEEALKQDDLSDANKKALKDFISGLSENDNPIIIAGKLI